MHRCPSPFPCDTCCRISSRTKSRVETMSVRESSRGLGPLPLQPRFDEKIWGGAAARPLRIRPPARHPRRRGADHRGGGRRRRGTARRPPVGRHRRCGPRVHHRRERTLGHRRPADLSAAREVDRCQRRSLDPGPSRRPPGARRQLRQDGGLVRRGRRTRFGALPRSRSGSDRGAAGRHGASRAIDGSSDAAPPRRAGDDRAAQTRHRPRAGRRRAHL